MGRLNCLFARLEFQNLFLGRAYVAACCFECMQSKYTELLFTIRLPVFTNAEC